MKKLKIILIVSFIFISIVGCTYKNNRYINDSSNYEYSKSEYLVSKYFELKREESFEDVVNKLINDNLVISDSGEYDISNGILERDIIIVDEENKLNLVFKNNKLVSKTFTYDMNNTNSTWFYSYYYDILDNKEEIYESHGIWENSSKRIKFLGENEMKIYLKENDF